MYPSRIACLALALAGSILTTAACAQPTTNHAPGTPKATSHAPGTPKAEAAPPECPGPDLIAATLAATPDEAERTVNGTVILCRYNSGTLVRFQLNSSAAAFAQGRAGFESSGQPTAQVDGLLDEAFSSSLGGVGTTKPVNTLVARKAAVEIMVSSRAPFDKQRSLIEKIAGTL
ncbi:hypothetical protein [Micromonospora sp. 4G55]|uniref:hypothetical protein n=1 Tax=Micromonospora sp. 4G55 TaxID=2806102 RepID=UPI001A404243|nr:hypothetical protein [Micromonospora sp. 4G55]MBM0258807.1 hypothetical protein [Micromonospora sp. 4G55]